MKEEKNNGKPASLVGRLVMIQNNYEEINGNSFKI